MVTCCSIVLVVLVASAPHAPQTGQAEPPQVLKVGDVVEGEIGADNPIGHAPALDAFLKQQADVPARGTTWRLEL